MNRWSLRGAAALAVLSLAIAGCQNQGSESVDALPSVDASIDASIGTESMGTDASGGASLEASPSEEASPSGS
jgi:hypothetical protein